MGNIMARDPSIVVAPYDPAWPGLFRQSNSVDDLSAFDDHPEVVEHLRVERRVATHGDQVGPLAMLEGTDLVIEA
jgi:hypothetical protein